MLAAHFTSLLMPQVTVWALTKARFVDTLGSCFPVPLVVSCSPRDTKTDPQHQALLTLRRRDKPEAGPRGSWHLSLPFPPFVPPAAWPFLLAEDLFAASCALGLIFQIPSEPDLVFI